MIDNITVWLRKIFEGITNQRDLNRMGGSKTTPLYIADTNVHAVNHEVVVCLETTEFNVLTGLDAAGTTSDWEALIGLTGSIPSGTVITVPSGAKIKSIDLVSGKVMLY